MDRVSHAWPTAFAPLLGGLSARQEPCDCWFADVEVSDEQLRALNCFEAAARHGRVWFTRPGETEPVAGEMNPLLGIGADPQGAGVRVRISFHDVGPAPRPP